MRANEEERNENEEEEEVKAVPKDPTMAAIFGCVMISLIYSESSVEDKGIDLLKMKEREKSNFYVGFWVGSIIVATNTIAIVVC